MSTETKSTIAAKLVLAMGEIDAVTKSGKNQAQGYNYVKAADVANEVRKVLVKHRIAFTYSVNSVERWSTDRFDRQSGTVIGQMNYVQLLIVVALIDADSGEKVEVTAIGWGSDTGDKAPYKALTGALKYALRMSFVIPDESDPENEKAEVEAEVERQKKNPSKNPTGPALVSALQGSVAQETARQAGERRAAEERNKLAEQQGIFALQGDVLSCIVKGIQPAKEGGKFCTVTVNGRLSNGGNFCNCFDKKLWDPLSLCAGKEVKFKILTKGQYINIVDLIWVEGQGEGGNMDSPFDDELPPADSYTQ
jgi:ERF superfamily